MAARKGRETVRVRVSADFDMPAEAARVVLCAGPKAVGKFLWLHFADDAKRLRVERVTAKTKP